MFAALTVLFLGLVPSSPTVVDRTEFYDVAGSTEHEVRAAINRLRPKDSKGERHDAVTNWDVQWKYRYVTVADGCALASFATTLEVVTIFPRWSNRQSGALTQRWDKYVAALEAHESEHMQIALHAAQVIHQRLPSVEVARTCLLLKASIDSKGQALLDQLHSEEAEYDRRTQHGASQGARFP
jgi:predicted secreted Zn-dependent protease